MINLKKIADKGKQGVEKSKQGIQKIAQFFNKTVEKSLGIVSNLLDMPNPEHKEHHKSIQLSKAKDKISELKNDYAYAFVL